MPLRRPTATALAVSLTGAVLALPSPPAAVAASAGPALSVDVSAARHAISPDIYGENFADTATARATGVTVDRFGGNSASRFNYQNNETNTGSDYFYENVGSTPASTFIGADRAAGMRTVWELPMAGYVSKNSPQQHPFLCGFPTETFPSQDSTDYWDQHCGNGVHNGVNLTGASPTSTSIAQDASWDQGEVAYLVSLYGRASAGGVPFYELDNEPSLWNSTHRDIHPNPLTYSELATKSTAAGAAVKVADPSASVLGPSDWGWCAYFYSAADSCNVGSDRQSHGSVDFAAYYLAQMKAYETVHGTRVLDYFDEHYYPQDSVSLTTAGSAAQQAQRLMETRTLWDPTYKDDSWIGTAVNSAVDLIPRMHGWVDANYPGTKLAVSEYNFGGLESLNGALAEADVLGIFGRERVDLATLWSPPTATQPGAQAFRLFRNYDGSGATFGDTYVSSTSADQTKLSVYGAQRSGDGSLTVLVLNKSTGDLTSSLGLSHFSAGAKAQVWRYSDGDLAKIDRQADIATSSSMSLTFPASSATLLVIPAAVPGTVTTGTGTVTTGTGSGSGTGTSPITAPPGTVITPSSPTVTGTSVTFSAPVPSLAPGIVSLTAVGGTALPISLVCRDAAAVVDCGTGPVTSVTVKPLSTLVPGASYRLQIIGLPAVAINTTYRAPTLVPVTSLALTYRWATMRSSHAVGGSILVSADKGATASYRFSGSSVTWRSATSPTGGVVDVLVDGKARGRVNEHGVTKWRVTHRLSRLGNGSHTLMLRVHSGRVAIDSPAVLTSWPTSKGAARTATVGSSTTLTFVGTGLEWAVRQSPHAGTVSVYVDGKRREVRSYTGHAGWTIDKTLHGLRSGRHTVTLVDSKGTLTLGSLRVL